jgi:hypothetical protein
MSEVKVQPMVVFKYPLECMCLQILMLPEGSEILHAGDQMGRVCLWAKVNQDIPADKKYIVTMVGTGHAVPEECEQQDFLGTVIQHRLRGQGDASPEMISFVWHLWGKWA